MITSQIKKILSEDPVTRPVFGGVYASNRLPKHVTPGKRLFIANTDPANKPGEHWTAFYFTPDNTCVYFDSYGVPPLVNSFETFMNNNASGWLFNNKRLQHPSSMLCGQYCIFFAVHICRGMPLREIISLFDNDLRLNDRMVAEFVEHYYGHHLSSPPYTSDYQSSKKAMCCQYLI